VIHINLLPGAKRKRPAGAKFDIRAALANLTDRVTDKYLVSAVAAGLLAVLAIGFMFTTQGVRAQGLAERERRAVQDSSRFAAVLRARAQAEADRDAVLRQLAIIRSIDDRRFVWPHLMEEISLALPPFTWLTSITQLSAPPNPAVTDSSVMALRQSQDTTTAAGRAAIQKARRDAAVAASGRATRFRIVGHTVDIQALTRFMRDLEASPFIQNVQLERAEASAGDQKAVTEYQIAAETEKPDPTEVTLVPLSVEGR
jgi:Tfp pilus assembly protein PilN